MDRQRIAGAATAATLTLGLAACGGGGGSGGAALSDAQLAAKANGICAQALANLKVIPAPKSPQSDPNGMAGYLDRVLPIAQHQVDQLAALRPNSSRQADWTDFIGKERAATALFGQARDKAHAHDIAGILKLTQTASTSAAAANAAAHKVGATACASG